MTYEQIVLFTLIVLVLAGLLWGRFRYDLVAFFALLVGVATGAVPHELAFSGFGHEATIIVALVLIISTGLTRSGAVAVITRAAISKSRALGTHIALFGGFAAALSAFMNNVAALAILMPVELQAAKQAERSPAQTLMPLSFATILGGMATLIGTPPNIIIASYRNDALGKPFAMFDFAPVGATVAIIGVAYVALIGWRLIPTAVTARRPGDELFENASYVSELVVGEKSKAIGQKVRDLDEPASENDVEMLGLVRAGKRLPGQARSTVIEKGDLLVVLATPDALDALAGSLGLKLQGKADKTADLSADMRMAEAVIARDSRLVGRTANDIQLLRGYGVSLIGLSRQGKRIAERMRRTVLQPGDVLLLLGSADNMNDVIARLGALPLGNANLSVTRHDKAWGAIGLFIAAIIAAAFGVVSLPVALGLVAIAFVVFEILPLRELYESVEWPVIVLLGSMIPLGAALESSGGTILIAVWLSDLTASLPPWVALTVILLVTMTLSDVLNNTATAVIAAPIAIELAHLMGVNPDPFLMAVAVGASCAFLTPIGHKNNMLILGPGGYSFGDYWRMGLPLEVIVVAVAVPAILLFWPL